MTSEEWWNEYNEQVRWLQVQEVAGLLTNAAYHSIVDKLFAKLTQQLTGEK